MRQPVFQWSRFTATWTLVLAFAACEINDPIGSNGALCMDGALCISGFCVDGLCCDTACSGTCQACSAMKKGSGVDGTCENIKYATDPDDECAAGACSGWATCKLDNGIACASNANCLSNNCVDDVCCNEVCDGPCLACSALKKRNGTDGTCAAIAADTDPDNECSMGHCDGNGVCTVLATNGTTCNADSECSSNFCVSGICCDSACSDVCNACNHAGMEGTCISTCPPSSCTDLGLPDPPSIPGFPVSSLPLAMTSADFNGDGLIDIITTLENKPYMSLLLATGNSAFAASVDSIVGSSPRSIVAADLNGDGKPDVATASYYGNYASVHINLGNGTFAAKIDYPVGTSPESIAAADLNGDGKIDLVTSSRPSNSVSVLMNNGNGTFAPAVAHATSSNPRVVAAVDLNGDGKADIASANSDPSSIGKVSILLSNGNGTFAPKVDYLSVASPMTIAAADFTGDGQPDLAITNFYDQMVVLQNNGNGTFAPKVDYTIEDHSNLLVAADVDNDGDTDLISGNTSSFYVSVHYNQNGAFPVRSEYLSPGFVKGLSVFDATGDGKNDIIVGDYNLSILPNLGKGTFPVDHLPKYGTGVGRPIAVDVNNDGHLDFVAPLTQSSGVMALINDGNGSFSNTYTSAAPGSTIGPIAAGDFNGDGLQDLVTTHDNMYCILFNQGDNTFVLQYSSGTADGINAVTTGDFNGDGLADVAFSMWQFGMPSSHDELYMMFGNGDGTFGGWYTESWSTIVQCGGSGQHLIAADFDNDGAQELVFAHCASNMVRILKPTGIRDLTTVGSANVESVTGVRLGDFNGDGMFDFVTTAISGINVFLRQGPFTFAPPVLYQGYGDIAVGDLNNDGTPDIVARNRYNSIIAMLNQGNATFATPNHYFAGLGPSGIISGDWNGDGRDDLAFNTNATISVMLSQCAP